MISSKLDASARLKRVHFPSHVNVPISQPLRILHILVEELRSIPWRTLNDY